MPLHRLAGIMFCVCIYTADVYPVLADAIDGHRCFPDRKSMSIQGPTIVTPGGSRIQGDYGRHFFSYVVPPIDPGAGGDCLDGLG